MKKTIAKLFLPLIFLTALVTPVQAATYTLTLYAGQDIPVGTVTITTGILINSALYLTVTYDTVDGWELIETHLYVGSVAPAKHSPGKFPYKHESLGGATTDTYTIPYSDFEGIPGATVYIAAHAVVEKGICIVQEETGWASDGCLITNHPFERGWGSYSSMTL